MSRTDYRPRGSMGLATCVFRVEVGLASTVRDTPAVDDGGVGGRMSCNGDGIMWDGWVMAQVGRQREFAEFTSSYDDKVVAGSGGH